MVAKIFDAAIIIAVLWYLALIAFYNLVPSCQPGYEAEYAVCYLGGANLSRYYHWAFWLSLDAAIFIGPIAVIAVFLRAAWKFTGRNRSGNAV